MTKEDIILMAREAGFVIGYGSPALEKLEVFATAVYDNVTNRYMQLFLDPENQPTQFGTATQEYREQEVREAKRQERDEFKEHALAMARAAIIGAVKNEREACAKVCDSKAETMAITGKPCDPDDLAAAIRARGQA